MGHYRYTNIDLTPGRQAHIYETLTAMGYAIPFKPWEMSLAQKEQLVREYYEATDGADALDNC